MASVKPFLTRIATQAARHRPLTKVGPVLMSTRGLKPKILTKIDPKQKTFGKMLLEGVKGNLKQRLLRLPLQKPPVNGPVKHAVMKRAARQTVRQPLPHRPEGLVSSEVKKLLKAMTGMHLDMQLLALRAERAAFAAESAVSRSSRSGSQRFESGSRSSKSGSRPKRGSRSGSSAARAPRTQTIPGGGGSRS